MKTEAVTPDQKKRRIQEFLDQIAREDSLVIIHSKQLPDNQVRSETLTFIYPQHMTAMKNTCTDLAFNLSSALKDLKKNHEKRPSEN